MKVIAPRPKQNGSNVTVSLLPSEPQTRPVHKAERECWRRSVWLRRPTLLAFVAIFTAFWICMIVLWRWVETHNGLRLTLSSNHYAWTYGPTAILVIVLSLWRQVDYQLKAAQPWMQMHKGFTPALQSLLLDYLSPWQVQSLVMSAKNKHFLVASSITGFVLLKIMILVSTGLLYSSPTILKQGAVIHIIDKFDASPLWGTTNLTGSGPVRKYNTDLSPIKSYVSYLDGDIPMPNNVEDHIVFQLYETSGFMKNVTTVTAEIDVFVPVVTCEEAKMTQIFPYGKYSLGGTSLTVSLESSDCSVGKANILNSTGQLVNQTFISFANCPTVSPDVCFPWTNGFFFSSINCTDQVWYGWNGSELINNDTPDGYRLAVMVANFTNEPWTYSDPSSNFTDIWNIPTLVNGAATICKLDYNVARANVTQNLVTGVRSINIGRNESSKPTKLYNLTATQLSDIILSGIVDASGHMQVPPYENEGQRAARTRPWLSNFSNQLIDIMARSIPNDQSVMQVYNDTFLRNITAYTLEALATYIVANQSKSSADVQTNGLLTFIEDHLHIRPAALWSMIVGFLLLSMLVAAMAFAMKDWPSPRLPQLILTRAALLAMSPSTQNLLAGTGGLNAKKLQHKLTNREFRSSMSNGRFQMLSKRKVASRQVDDRAETEAKPWTPLIGKKILIFAVLCTPLLAIIILEILYRQSVAHNGLLAMTSDSSASAYAVRYSSTLAIFLIATMYNSLEFSIATFTPFTTLKSGSATARRSMSLDLLGLTPLQALYNSLSGRHFGAAAATVAALIGSVLTVIVSGLWFADNQVPSNVRLKVALADSWNATWATSYTEDNGAATELGNILNGNIVSMPPAIVGDLVLPRVQSLQPMAETQNYTFQVPALRPFLDCHEVPRVGYSIRYLPWETFCNCGFIYFNATMQLPDGCQAGPYGNSTEAIIGDYGVKGISDNRSSINDLHMGAYKAFKFDFSANDNDNSTSDHDNPPHCPSISVVYGKYDYMNDSTTVYDLITALACYQRVQLVPTIVTYTGDPSLQLLSSQNPVSPIETEVVNLTSFDGSSSFPYRIQAHLSSAEFVLENVMDELNVTFDDISGPGNVRNLIDVVNKYYKRYMVHAVNLNFRDEATNPKTLLEGNTTAYIIRLKVNPTSKITLQVILGAMVLFGTLAYALVDLRNTLPQDPCSIGATMSLLAGSEICKKDMIPPGAEFMSRKELDNLLDGYLFSLGWWRKGQANPSVQGGHIDTEDLHRKYRFGIDIGEPEKLGFIDSSSWLKRRKPTKKSGIDIFEAI